MDEKNNTVNNNDNQNTMNYSFDFANQVDTTAQNTTPTAATTETLEVNRPIMSTPAPTPVESLNVDNTVSQATVAEPTVNAVPTPVEPLNVDNTVSQATVTEPTVNVAPTPVDSVNTNNVNSVPSVEPVNTGDTTPQATPAVEANTTQVASEVGTMAGVTPVMPVTPETVMAQNKEDENIELIKDKKATKNFLIVLFVLLIAFIIALPFIFQLMG